MHMNVKYKSQVNPPLANGHTDQTPEGPAAANCPRVISINTNGIPAKNRKSR